MKKAKETTGSGLLARRPVLVGRTSHKYPIAFAASATALIELTCEATSTAHSRVIVVDATVHALYPRMRTTGRRDRAPYRGVVRSRPAFPQHSSGNPSGPRGGQFIALRGMSTGGPGPGGVTAPRRPPRR